MVPLFRRRSRAAHVPLRCCSSRTAIEPLICGPCACGRLQPIFGATLIFVLDLFGHLGSCSPSSRRLRAFATRQAVGAGALLARSAGAPLVVERRGPPPCARRARVLLHVRAGVPADACRRCGAGRKLRAGHFARSRQSSGRPRPRPFSRASGSACDLGERAQTLRRRRRPPAAERPHGAGTQCCPRRAVPRRSAPCAGRCSGVAVGPKRHVGRWGRAPSPPWPRRGTVYRSAPRHFRSGRAPPTQVGGRSCGERRLFGARARADASNIDRGCQPKFGLGLAHIGRHRPQLIERRSESRQPWFRHRQHVGRYSNMLRCLLLVLVLWIWCVSASPVATLRGPQHMLPLTRAACCFVGPSARTERKRSHPMSDARGKLRRGRRFVQKLTHGDLHDK